MRLISLLLQDCAHVPPLVDSGASWPIVAPPHDLVSLTGHVEAATDYVASAIADQHGRGEVAAKIQAHIVMAAV